MGRNEKKNTQTQSTILTGNFDTPLLTDRMGQKISKTQQHHEATGSN